MAGSIPRFATKVAKGSRGSWFATVDGNSYPCIHLRWLNGQTRHYRDEGYYDYDKWPAFREAIETDKIVILTSGTVTGKDGRTKEGLNIERTGYIAMWRIENVMVNGEIFELDLIEKIFELK